MSHSHQTPLHSCKILPRCLLLLTLICAPLAAAVRAQAVTTYSARTDRLLQPKTAMDPPAVNTIFQDPDFGSQMVRVTDANTRPDGIGKFFRNASTGDLNT